jgi:hypothetical protein
MLDSYFDLTWKRPAKRVGFRWEGEQKHQMRLVRIDGAPFADYHPLKREPALFRNFAALEPTPGSILKFANRYGSLGRFADNREPFQFWQDKIAFMRNCVDVWQAWGKWNTMRELRSILSSLPAGVAAGTDDTEALAHNAAMYLYLQVLSTLGNWLGLPLQTPDGPLVSVSLKSRQVVTFRPPSLLDAMYLQIGLAIIERKGFEPCEVCGRYFERGLSRSDKTTCSVTCRGKRYRQHQRRARDLHRKHWTPRQIAKKLGSEVSTIKKWLSQTKE